MNKYDDIINLPHWEPRSHIRMSPENRAAQFSSFKALTGYDDEVAETARLTDRRAGLSEDDIRRINDGLNYLQEHLNESPQATVTYFVPDTKKAGGSYQKATGRVYKIDIYHRMITMNDSMEKIKTPENSISIPIDDIFRIEI